MTRVVPTSLLLTTVLSAFAVLGGAIFAIVNRIGAQVDRLGERLDQTRAELTARVDAQGVDLGRRIDAQGVDLGWRIDALGSEVSALRAAVAGLDSRVATLERRDGVG